MKLKPEKIVSMQSLSRKLSVRAIDNDSTSLPRCVVQSVDPPMFFFKSETTITSRKVNVNAIVTSNFAQIVKKATCLMAITQDSSNSLTSELK